MTSLLDNYFLQTIFLFLLFALILKFNGKPKTGSDGGKLRGPWVYLETMYITLFAKREIVSGCKESLYQKVYRKCGSANSGFTKDPVVLRIFGKTVGLSVSEYDTMVRVLKHESFSGRASGILVEEYSGKPGGILLSDGRIHKELKKYTVKKLSQLGFGKNDVITSTLSNQLPDLLDHLALKIKLTNNKIQVEHLFTFASINAVWCIIGGNKFSEGDDDFFNLRESTTALATAHLAKFFGIIYLSKIKGVREIFGYSKYKNNIATIRNILKKAIEERKSLGSYKFNPESFVDHFLQKIDECENDESMNDIYCKEQLVTLMSDLVMTGMDTTSSYLESMVLFMVLNPHVQTKVQEEIDSVLGASSLPLYHHHKARMPYTVATIYEIYRNANSIPIIPRITSEDVTLGDIHLPKGTLTSLPVTDTRVDDVYWKDPEVFRPERFLDAENKIIHEKVDHMLLFGLGSRMCPAAAVARSTSFTYTAGLLQKYTIIKADESEILGMSGTFGLNSGPEPFHVKLLERST